MEYLFGIAAFGYERETKMLISMLKEEVYPISSISQYDLAMVNACSLSCDEVVVLVTVCYLSACIRLDSTTVVRSRDR